MVSSLARSKYCQQNCWRDEDCVSDVHFDKGHPYMMSEQKGGGVQNSPKFADKKYGLCWPRGERCRKIPKFCGVHWKREAKKTLVTQFSVIILSIANFFLRRLHKSRLLAFCSTCFFLFTILWISSFSWSNLVEPTCHYMRVGRDLRFRLSDVHFDDAWMQWGRHSHHKDNYRVCQKSFS